MDRDPPPHPLGRRRRHQPPGRHGLPTTPPPRPPRLASTNRRRRHPRSHPTHPHRPHPNPPPPPPLPTTKLSWQAEAPRSAYAAATSRDALGATLPDARDMNPYGVGGSTASREQRQGRCSCCQVSFAFVAPVTAAAPRRCPECRHHHPTPGESRERRLARFEEHEPRLVEQMDAAVRTARQARRDQINAEQATAAALQDRSRWRSLVREISQLHHEDERGRCACGLDKFPCVYREGPARGRRLGLGMARREAATPPTPWLGWCHVPAQRRKPAA